MKSKNFIFLTIIILMVSVYPVFFIIIPKNNNNLSIGMENNLKTNPEEIKTADVSFDEQLNMAESIALWLKNEWDYNKFNRSNSIRLGQDGIAGVGDFFIELNQITSNPNYLL